MTRQPWPRALVDGALVALADARVPVTDDGVARGDGAFETIGVWDGRPFRLDEHLERLAASLRAVLLPAVDLGIVRAEAGRLLEGADGDAALRVYLTGSGTRVLTLGDVPERGDPVHLVPQPAPWIQPREAYGPAGAKTMSYLPNMVATRAAVAAGGDDALLHSPGGTVLEGPTFAIYWVREGVLHAPSLALGIIDSVTRRAVIAAARDAGVGVRQGVFGLDDLASADEVMASSAVRDVVAVRRVGDARFDGPTPLRDHLSAALTKLRRG